MRRRTTILAVVAIVALVIAVLLWRGPRAGAPDPTTTAARAASVRPSLPERRGAIALRRAPLHAEQPRLSLRGVVVDAAGAPVAGAAVALARPERTVVTDGAGRFELRGLLADRYTLEARAGARVAGPIVAALTDSSPEVILRLYRGFALEVEVVAADDGRPVAAADVEVALISLHAGAGRLRARTDRDGVARLDGLTYIGHELLVSAAGFVDTRRGPGPDLLVAGPDVRRLHVELERARLELTGRLVDEAGAPVAAGTVEVIRYQAGATAVDEARARARVGAVDPHAALRSGLGIRADGEGRFRVGLDDGAWVLVATADGLATAVSEPVFTADAATPRELTLTLSRGRRIEGVVVDGADVPVPGAAVEVRWLDGTAVIGHGHADGTGGFAIGGLPAAPVELIASTRDGRSRPTAVDLVERDAAEQLVVLDLDGVITGAVVDTTGAPIADAVVTFLDERPGRAPSLYPDVVITGADGRFRVAGVARRLRYQLSAARPQHGRFVQHAAATSALAGDDVVITVPAGGAIIGRVRVAGDARRLTVRDLQTLTQVRPAADGSFRLDDLPALSYQLRIAGVDVADVIVAALEVRPGQVTDAGTIDVAADRTLIGSVVDRAGALLDEATVRVEVDARYAVVTRAERGRFTVRVPASAGLVLTASHPATGQTAATTLAAGHGRTPVRLAMRPTATVVVAAAAHGRGLAEHVVTAWPADAPRPTEPAAAAITDDGGAATLVVGAGRWAIELALQLDGDQPRVYQQVVEVVADQELGVRYDATDAPTGTIPAPRPDLVELPIVGDEGTGGDDGHH